MYVEIKTANCKNKCREEAFTYFCFKCGTRQTAFAFVIGDMLLMTCEHECIVCGNNFKNCYHDGKPLFYMIDLFRRTKI